MNIKIRQQPRESRDLVVRLATDIYNKIRIAALPCYTEVGVVFPTRRQAGIEVAGLRCWRVAKAVRGADKQVAEIRFWVAVQGVVQEVYCERGGVCGAFALEPHILHKAEAH